MKNKSQKTPQKPILQDCELIEITDPAEQAALDQRCRAAEKSLASGHQERQTPKSERGK